jgi:hypothetical protein
VSEDAQVAAMVDRAVAELGRLNVAFNRARISSTRTRSASETASLALRVRVAESRIRI